MMKNMKKLVRTTSGIAVVFAFAVVAFTATTVVETVNTSTDENQPG